MGKKHKGISRIDSSHTHGWYVRIYANGTVFDSKLFSDKQYGGKKAALKSAIMYRDQRQAVAVLAKSLSPSDHRPFFSKPPKNNKTGVVGVNEVKTVSRGKNVHYFQATWNENGKPRTKKFYVFNKRSVDEAFKLAVDHRKAMEEKLLNNN
jgi:hypothetical protein